MSNKAKAPVIILVVLVFVFLLLSGGGFYLYQKEHIRSVALQEELDDLKTRLRVYESKVEESKKKMNEMDQLLNETKLKIDNLTTQLEEEKGAKAEALSQIDALRSDLEQQKRQRSDLEDKLNQTQQEAKNAQSRLKELENKKMELEAKVEELNIKSQDLETKMQGVELGEIVVSPDKSRRTPMKPAAKPAQKKAPAAQQVSVEPVKAASAGADSKVLVVNREYNFAVLNVGSRDGISVGSIFAIYHANKYIGDVKVSKVHDSMSAADFSSPNLKEVISEGDKAVRKGK